ncbi:helix-turn-helix domain-containing protein [Natronomonas sp. LN261]|jgi:DNA-binding transcriptional ArsR family regulator|uniref:winged helix-turn-helix domain-containing protein n=1 Tax=Natronomonas sp. LN261 TaxID=2750669 RepID=UPI002106BCF3|nr:helix-turn-helix domain-containing protein [Natronomonas sp. LN261]
MDYDNVEILPSDTKMSSKLRPKDGLQASGEESSRRTDCETVLTALEDPDCRALLEATAEEALTAGELIERCDVPRSTTYRKLERLTEAGLLEERIRLSPDGKHASEYRRTFDDVTISLCESDGMTVGLSSAATAETPEAAD